MAKGVKKIAAVEGLIYKNLCTARSVVMKPDQYVWFAVKEWEPGTTNADLQKGVTWMRQDMDRKVIVNQLVAPATQVYGINLSKKLCGSYFYYIEASLSGKRDYKTETGIYVRGLCPQKIISSKWSTQRGGKSIKNNNKTNYISYGHIIYLHLETEGLNGNKLTVEVYNQQTAKADKKIWTYTDVQVIDGEVNLKIQNTFSWMAQVSNIQTVEEFYVKVKDQASGAYVKDNLGQDLHAIYLNVKDKVATSNTSVAQNQTPTKIYKPDVNAVRYEPCKFDRIKITEVSVKDGKATPATVLLFDNGKSLKNVTHPEDPITRTVHFEFDSATLDQEGVKTLNNILKFLLEHQHSTIKLDGYACVIGKMEYNKDLSQKRSDIVKKFFADGGLEAKRIISVGKGEINPTDDQSGRDNIKHKDEKEYIEARRVDIAFKFNGHDAQTIVYETVAPSISNKKDKKELTVDIVGFDSKSCFRDKDKHTNVVKVVNVGQKVDSGDSSADYPASSFRYWVYSDLSRFNAFPLQYFWPGATTPNAIYYHVHSCRYFSDKKHATFVVLVYPDIKWTLEFKWNHTQPFAYSFGNKLHPHDIKTGREKVIGSAIDAGWSKNYGEMAQSFGLSLKAEWDAQSQSVEIGKEFGERIAKTLALFNKIKSMTDRIANSPMAEGRFVFEVKAPVIAVSAQWYLERALPDSPEVATIIAIGVDAKPLVEASFTIDLFKIFVESAGNAVCPGAGSVIKWILEKLGKEAGIQFLVIFAGGIYVNGKVTINTAYPKETTGEVKATGKIQVTIEFKAWAKAGYGYLGFDGEVKANATTAIAAGLKIGADKKGIYASPVAEFAGIKATFVAVGTVKFGVFKRTFTYEGESQLVDKGEMKFEKTYI